MSADAIFGSFFGDFFGDFFGFGSFDEPPDSVPLRILGLTEVPADDRALRAAFVKRTLAIHPDLNPIEESSWREVHGEEWAEIQWARVVLRKKLWAKTATVTVSTSRPLATRDARNATMPVTNREGSAWWTLSPRNARILAEIERELERRDRTVARRSAHGRKLPGPLAWWEKLSGDERFTNLAIESRLVCSRCVEPITDAVYLFAYRRDDWYGFGDGLRCFCPACWAEAKSKPIPRRGDGPHHECGCGIEIVCTREPHSSAGWWYAERARSCSPSCAREARNAKAREMRQAARAGVTCAVCGEEFTPGRRGARYCSNACRQDAYRKRKLGAWPS